MQTASKRLAASLQRRATSSPLRRRGAFTLLVSVVLLTLLFSPACDTRDERDETDASGVVIVSAPAAGEVRRVLVNEGQRIGAGDAVVEIAVRTQSAAPTPARGEDPVQAAGRQITSAQTEIEAARAEVVRNEVEVQRLTPLVASGQASQAADVTASSLGYPQDSTLFYPLLLYQHGFTDFQMGYASAIAMVLLVVSFAVTLAIVLNSRRWVQAGALR